MRLFADARQIRFQDGLSRSLTPHLDQMALCNPLCTRKEIAMRILSEMKSRYAERRYNGNDFQRERSLQAMRIICSRWEKGEAP